MEHIEAAVEETGMGQRVAPAPAICFLDLAGYTRLTVVQDGDYFGRTVNLSARIAGQAGADQVMVSDEVAAAESDGVRFEALGPVPLRGFARPVRHHLALPA